MTLRLKRGPDLIRQTIVFQEGEIVYASDTKKLYVGDGVTLGGVEVGNQLPGELTGDFDLNGYSFIGDGSISINGSISATLIQGDFVGDGSGLTNIATSLAGQSIEASIEDSDGNVIVNTITSTIAANVINSPLVSYTPITELDRDALVPTNGMVIYNSTANKFQGYQNGAWINLDGTPV